MKSKKNERLEVVTNWGFGSLLEFGLVIESSEGHALDPRRHMGDCLQPLASWRCSFASCLMATAYPAVVPALLSICQVRLRFIKDEDQ